MLGCQSNIAPIYKAQEVGSRWCKPLTVVTNRKESNGTESGWKEILCRLLVQPFKLPAAVINQSLFAISDIIHSELIQLVSGLSKAQAGYHIGFNAIFYQIVLCSAAHSLAYKTIPCQVASTVR